MTTTENRLYAVKINREANASYELETFRLLKEAYDFFVKLDLNELEEGEEYELAPYEDGGLADWTDEELNLINRPLNQWVIRKK